MTLPDPLVGLKVLFSLNLGLVDLREWERLSTEEKFWYLPVFLAQEFLPKEFLLSFSLDFAVYPKDDWSIRSFWYDFELMLLNVSYWLMLAKLIPRDQPECLGEHPEDLVQARSFFKKFCNSPPSPGNLLDCEDSPCR